MGAELIDRRPAFRGPIRSAADLPAILSIRLTDGLTVLRDDVPADMLPALSVRLADFWPGKSPVLLTQLELARLVGVQPDTIYRWRHRGLLEPLVGGFRRGMRFAGDAGRTLYGEREAAAAAIIVYMRRLGVRIGLLANVWRVLMEAKRGLRR